MIRGGEVTEHSADHIGGPALVINSVYQLLLLGFIHEKPEKAMTF